MSNKKANPKGYILYDYNHFWNDKVIEMVNRLVVVNG